MDFKPTPEILDDLASKDEDEIVRKRLEAETAQREERIIAVAKFARKLETIEATTRMGQFDPEKKYEIGRETEWVDIKEDEDTWLTLQASISTKYNPKTYDGDKPVPRHTEYTIFVRFMDRSAEEDRASEPRALAGLRINSASEQSIFINTELGLTAGNIPLGHKDDINPKMVEQILEIETELLDPIIAANPYRRLSK